MNSKTNFSYERLVESPERSAQKTDSSSSSFKQKSQNGLKSLFKRNENKQNFEYERLLDSPKSFVIQKQGSVNETLCKQKSQNGSENKKH